MLGFTVAQLDKIVSQQKDRPKRMGGQVRSKKALIIRRLMNVLLVYTVAPAPQACDAGRRSPITFACLQA
jgi:hypothetical protein